MVVGGGVMVVVQGINGHRGEVTRSSPAERARSLNLRLLRLETGVPPRHQRRAGDAALRQRSHDAL